MSPPRTRSAEARIMEARERKSYNGRFQPKPYAIDCGDDDEDSDEENGEFNVAGVAEGNPEANTDSDTSEAAARSKRALGGEEVEEKGKGVREVKRPRIILNPGPRQSTLQPLIDNLLTIFDDAVEKRNNIVKELSTIVGVTQYKHEEVQQLREQLEQRVETEQDLQEQLEKTKKLQKKLQIKFDELNEMKAGQQQQLEQTQESQKKLQVKFDRLNETHKTQMKQKRKAEKDLKEAQQSILEMKEENFREWLEERPDYGDPNKVFDDELQAKWSGINLVIEKIADCADLPLDPDELDQKKPVLAYLAQEAKKSNVLTEPVFPLHRLLWQRIYQQVFQGNGGIWGGRMGLFLSSFLDKAKNIDENDYTSLSLLSRMKFKFAKDIDADVGVDKQAMEKVSDAIYSEFASFVPAENCDKFRHMISDLVTRATEMMVIITKSRAIFTIGMECFDDRDETRILDPETMEIVLGVDRAWGNMNKSKVLFALRPPLEKIGSADGGGFEIRGLLCKIGVVAYYPSPETPGAATPAGKHPPDEAPPSTPLCGETSSNGTLVAESPARGTVEEAVPESSGSEVDLINVSDSSCEATPSKARDA
ncbi:hypothetical protein CDD83_9821 [Cordyceps sp. RAO-2017]|nr:hypothetical protein CDD83_9821 [Cordyceps sp. RAO-2017]